MASWARTAGARVAGLLARQEGSLARAAQQAGQQTRGFAAGKGGNATEGCKHPGAAQAAGVGTGRELSVPPAAREPSACSHTTCNVLLALCSAGGHGHHDSVTHAGLTIHKAAGWHVWTGKAFAGVMWCVFAGADAAATASSATATCERALWPYCCCTVDAATPQTPITWCDHVVPMRRALLLLPALRCSALQGIPPTAPVTCCMAPNPACCLQVLGVLPHVPRL